MPTTVWAPDPLPELDGRTGFVQVDDELAETLLAADQVQRPQVGAFALRAVGSGAAGTGHGAGEGEGEGEGQGEGQGEGEAGEGAPRAAPAADEKAAGTYGTRDLAAERTPRRTRSTKASE